MKRKIITISLIVSFSVLLWVFVSFDGEFSITLNLPTQVIDVPESHSVSSISANEVSISITGKGWQLAQYTLGRDPKFLIPSPNEVGEKEIPTRNVLHANSWLSTSMQLAEIIPEKIKVNLENTISKKVAIIPVISLSYKPGYGLVSPITLEPDSALVTGPKSLVDEINIINTEGKGLTNLEDKSVVVLGIKQQKYVQIDVSECIVNFDVQKIVDKTFEEIVVGTKSKRSGYELILSPPKLTIVLRGGISQLSKLKNDDLDVYVKFEQAINDLNGAIEPIIEIPEFTSLIDIKPNRLEYIIKKY